MKRFRTTGFICLALTILFVGTLLFLRLGKVFTAERKIEGIEEAGVSFEDFKIPTDVKVVGIGEASHGNREFQVVKKEVFQKMVEEGDARAICFEMTAAEASGYNDAVHETETNLTDLIALTDYPLYDTAEIVDLLEWMREYNRTVPYEESLMIYGVDMQGAYRSVEYLQSVIAKGTDLLTEEEKEKINSVNTESDEELALAKEFFEGLAARLSAEDTIEERLLAVHAQILLQYVNAPSFESQPTEYNNHRDLSMATNLKSYYEIEQSRGYSQIIVTAHNGHVMKGKSEAFGAGDESLAMGERINQLFDGSYFCIGTEFYNATVNIHTAGTFDDAYERADHDFCSDDILAYQARYFEGGRYCLDFTKITDSNSRLYKLIHSNVFTGMVGEGYNLLNEIQKGYRIKLIPADRYDAIIYYYNASPIDPIHY